MTNLSDLADRIDGARCHKALRFSLCQDRGWVVTDSEQTARILCDLWNNRKPIAEALRAYRP